MTGNRKIERTSLNCAVGAILVGLTSLIWASPAECQTTRAGSVVEIVRPGTSQLGAGVQIMPGLILTAAHVVDGDAIVEVSDDRKGERLGRIVALDADNDLALVRIDGAADLAVSPLSCQEPSLGAVVTMIGHPYGRRFVRSWGHVIAPTSRIANWANLIVIDRDAFPGMSGGPAIAADGAVVALVVAATSYSGRPSGPAGAVPGDVLCGFVAAHPEATGQAEIRVAGL